MGSSVLWELLLPQFLGHLDSLNGFSKTPPMSSIRTGSLEGALPLKTNKQTKPTFPLNSCFLSAFLASFLNHRVCTSQKLPAAAREEEGAVVGHFDLSSLVRFLKENHIQPSQSRTSLGENPAPRNVPDSCCPEAEKDAEGLGAHMACRVAHILRPSARPSLPDFTLHGP